MPKKLNTCGKPSPQALGKANSFPVALGVPSFIHFLVHSVNKYFKKTNKQTNTSLPNSGLYGILYIHLVVQGDSLVAQMVKRLPAMQETRVQSLGREDTLEKQMATHSSILAWRIP